MLADIGLEILTVVEN